jgi:hypothetical protein
MATTHPLSAPPASPQPPANTGKAVIAAPEALPAVLADPPWLRRRPAGRTVVVEGLACPAQPPAIRWAAGERAAWAASTRAVGYVNLAVHNGARWELTAAYIADPQQPRALLSEQIALFVGGPRELGRQVIEQWRITEVWGAPEWMPVVVGRFELLALPMALEAARHNPTQVVSSLLPFADTGIAALMAEALAGRTALRSVALAWLDRHPSTAARALIPPALGAPGPARRQADRALRALVGGGHREATAAAAAEYGSRAEAALVDVLATDPLDLLPARMPRLPVWADPMALAPIRLRDAAGTLPDDSARHVLSMLALCRHGATYAGISQVKAACESRSLAEFSWTLFLRWQAAGLPAKESWVLESLALLGDDETVHRLSAVIRTWPGEGRHARAAAGLDVLAAIGSDAALTQLRDIAATTTFSGLRDRALEVIAASLVTRLE